MLALRLVRGAHPLVQLRRLLVAAASAGVGFLLLCTLGYAAGHPDPGNARASGLRLLWCLVPLAAVVYFAVAVARTDPSTRPRPGLSAVGLGPARLTAIAAASTAVSCTLGSTIALAVFLHLRGDITGLPFDGAAADLLGARAPLPLAAALTLLAVLPLSAAVASGLALRPRRTKPDGRPRPDDHPGPDGRPDDRTGDDQAPAAPAPAPAGLPWGVALTAAGLAVEAYAARGGGGSPLPMPGRFEGSTLGVLCGWTLTALGLALAGPGIAYGCGKLLQAVRPGAVRLLAGRALQEEARRIGRPLGVLCAVASGVIAALTLYGGEGARPFGPLTGLGGALVLGCAVATLLTAALESKHARAGTTDALLRLGAPAATLRAAGGLRAAALLLVFGPLTAGVAHLAALPLTT